jgi:hypothetical protein
LSDEHLAEARRMAELDGLYNIEWRNGNIYDPGQWATVHRQGLQGVYSNLRHDARPNLAAFTRSRTGSSNGGTNR